MDLIWARYQKDQGPSYYLLLRLGERDGKIIALDSKMISETDTGLIRRSLTRLKGLAFEEQMQWLKENLPMSYSKSLRTFKADKMETLQVYNLKKLK